MVALTQKQLIANIDNWLLAKKSPMYGFADYMVILARHFGIPVALTAAIAQAETQCATDPKMPPADVAGHNAWGYGHPPGSTHGYAFPSWPDSINAVSERLAQCIHNEGCVTVEKLSGRWVNGSIDHPSEVWAANVSAVLAEFGGVPANLQVVALAAAP